MESNHIKIVNTTFLILEKKLWKNITLLEIKKKSKIKSFDDLIKTKLDLIKKINSYIDFKLSKEIYKIEQSHNKDMIFEILMMRFDILQKNRSGILSIFNSFKKNPKDLISLFPELLDSIILMINYTKISTKGISGQLRVKGIMIIYIFSFFRYSDSERISTPLFLALFIFD